MEDANYRQLYEVKEVTTDCQNQNFLNISSSWFRIEKKESVYLACGLECENKKIMTTKNISKCRKKQVIKLNYKL